MYTMHDEKCPKCSGHKLSFDVHCDNCNEFTITVPKGKKKAMQDLITELGYKSKGFLEKDLYADDGELGRYMLCIEAPRRDENTIRELLRNEI